MKLQKHLATTLFLSIIAIASSCDYQPDETYFRDLQKDTSAPTISINLPDNSDTVFLYQNTKIKLNYNLGKKKVYSTTFYINDTISNSYQITGSNSINYNIDILTKNKTIVKANVEVSSETGSLADKYGKEATTIQTKEWVLIYNPVKPTIISTIENGQLKLTWNAAQKKYPVKYILRTSTRVDTLSNNWFIDSTYVGGSETFQLSVNDNELSGFSATSTINYPLPKLHANLKDSFLVYWDPCKFYNNIGGYKIILNDNIIVDANPTDSVLAYKGVFGQTYHINLLIVSKKQLAIASAANYLTNITYELSMFPYNSTVYTPLSGSTMYYLSNNEIIQYSLSSRVAIDSLNLNSVNIAISPNNQYILSYDINGNLNLINPTGMKISKTIPLNNIISSVGINLNISDIGTSLFFDSSKNSLVVYDFATEQITNEIPLTNSPNEYKLSANGAYVFEPQTNVLYKLNAGSYSEIWSNKLNTSQFRFVEFSPNNNQIALFDGTYFYLKNCSNFATVKNFNLGAKTVISVDFTTNKILTYSNFNFYIYSLIDGSLLQSIPTAMYANNYPLFNNYIFGYHCQLNLNN